MRLPVQAAAAFSRPAGAPVVLVESQEPWFPLGV
jgi:hypothetical protein